MEKVETRLLDEWKANLDLLKFYETLKQQRFAHFLTIQTAFLAIFALLAKEAMGVFSLVSIAALAAIPAAPLFLSYFFLRLDARGRAFVDTANTRLLIIEGEWKERFPDNHFATYHDQFDLLSRRDKSLVEKYRAIRRLDKDPYHAATGAIGARLRGRHPSAFLLALDPVVQRRISPLDVAPGQSDMAP